LPIAGTKPLFFQPSPCGAVISTIVAQALWKFQGRLSSTTGNRQHPQEPQPLSRKSNLSGLNAGVQAESTYFEKNDLKVEDPHFSFPALRVQPNQGFTKN
jgi:hypothetical protein